MTSNAEKLQRSLPGNYAYVAVGREECARDWKRWRSLSHQQECVLVAAFTSQDSYRRLDRREAEGRLASGRHHAGGIRDGHEL